MPSEQDYQEALQSLRQGGIVAYPTETFYGLAVDPENDQAIAALYSLKKRNPRKKLSLLVPNVEALSACTTEISSLQHRLIEAFWPGPLTLVVPVSDTVLPGLTGGTGTLAVRVSSHPVAARLCRLWGGPLTATSANISGEPGFVTAAEVRSQWKKQLAFILDGGRVPGGQGSTIVNCAGNTCRILRKGVIPAKAIEAVLQKEYILCVETVD